jgi:hypothetical protein
MMRQDRAAWTRAAFAAVVFSLSVHTSADELPSRNAALWSPFVEWSVAAGTHDGNSFDVVSKVTFTHRESGEKRVTQMFYAGDDTWQFRFAGTRSGEWTFSTQCNAQDGTSKVARLHGHSGMVNVDRQTDSPHGFITNFGNKWGWQGTGAAFIPQYVMAKIPSAYLDGDGDVDTALIDADIQQFVVEHGFTGFHIPVRGRWFDGENPDPAVYSVLETLIRKVHARGGACHIWLWGSHEDSPATNAGGPLSEKDRRNLRYLAARLGPLPGWSMGYGFDTENGWASVEELDAWKAFLEEHMGWDHFLGARVGYDEKGLFAVRPRPPRPPHDAGHRAPIADKYTTWLGGDYIGYTSYRPLYPRYTQAIWHHSDKPSFEEDRFRLRDSDEWSYKDYSPELTRRGLWHSAMAGGVANIWGNLLPNDDHEGSRPYEIKDQIKTYSRFFAHRFLKEMESEYAGPELRLVTPDGEHAVIYREDADLVRLDLRRMKGSRPAIAVDTKKAYEEISIRTLSPGEHTWEAPYRSDWAVAVGNFVDLQRDGSANP